MRIVLTFSDHARPLPRLREGDLCILAREENGQLVTKFNYICTGIDPNEDPLLQPVSSVEELITQASKINVEIYGHSSKGGKCIQSDATDKYPEQSVALDSITKWLEYNLLRQQTSRSTVSFLTCEAADGNKDYPAVAEQVFALFNTKPQKVTARIGFGYVGKKMYSLGTIGLALKNAVDQEAYKLEPQSVLERLANPILRVCNRFFPYSTKTNLGEKFVYFLGNDLKTYKIDKQIYTIFHIIKDLDPNLYNQDLGEISRGV